MRTEAQVRQLEDARRNIARPDVRARLSSTMKQRWRERPETFGNALAAMHSPEARRKRAEAARRPLVDRFWGKVSPEPNSGCWLWIGSADRLGYGQLRVDGRAVLATHISLQLAGKPRPFHEACARHKCDNPNCVNPDHLQWGTLKDNSQDSIKRGRADFSGLKAGHERMQALKAERPWIPCGHCGKPHQPERWQLRKNKNFFCSAPCSTAWQKANYTGRPIASWSSAP